MIFTRDHDPFGEDWAESAGMKPAHQRLAGAIEISEVSDGGEPCRQVVIPVGDAEVHELCLGLTLVHQGLVPGLNLSGTKGSVLIETAETTSLTSQQDGRRVALSTRDLEFALSCRNPTLRKLVRS